MAQSSNKADRRKQDIHMRLRTLVATALFLIFGFGVLIYQLYALQLRDAELYRTEAVAQQLKDTVLPAARGSILSANGKVLAKSNTVWNIICDPSSSVKAGATDAQLQTAAEEIANLLNDGTTAETVYSVLTATNDAGEPYQYRVVAKGVEKPVADAILAYADEYRIPAEKENATGARVLYLRTEQTSVRSYPYGEFLASVLGFCNADGEGAYGLEKSYEETLAGTPGRSIAETNRDGEVLDESAAKVYDAVDGNDLVLTIDENVQSIVEKYLNEAMDTYQVHGRGCAIVMNVKTGAVLAMATTQQFDPNQPYVISDEKMQSILDAESLTADDIEWLQSRLGEKQVADIVADGSISRETTQDEDGNTVSSEYTRLQGMLRESQWKNKNITELYIPGSVFKLVTAAAGLDSGVMTAGQEFYCGGELTVNEDSEKYKHPYHCALGYTHGLQDMAQALNNSCNIWFIQAAQILQPSTFYNYIEAFGFTKPTGIDLPNETRWTSVYNAEQMANVDTHLYTAAFGQNESITPMQMATAVAAVANGGYLVTPYVVDKITDKAGNVVSQTETDIRRQVISEEVSTQLLAMMEETVGHGEEGHSNRNAYVAGYRIGGKSGTAERTDRSRRSDGDYYKQMSFAAVLPVNDPEIEVFVMLDDPRWVRDLAGQIVAPIVGNIISEVAPYLGLEQDPSYNPTEEVKVHYCLENTWTGAQVELNKQGLQHRLIGENGTIVYQYPVAGATVPAGSTVYLYTQTDQDSKTTVPDVVGSSGTFAAQTLKSSSLNVRLVGSESGKVVSQDVAGGSEAAYGTVVTITTE